MTCLNKITKSKTFKKIIPVLTLIQIFTLAIFISNRAAEAAKLSDGAWAQGGSPGTTTITFTNTTALDASSDIIITFPDSATLDQTGTDISVTGQTSPVRTNNTVDNTVTIELVDGTLDSSLAVTITMTDALSAYTTSTYAQESLAINTENAAGTPQDFGVALITNDNTTTVTASVPLFVNMAIDDTSIELGTLSTASVSTATQQYTINSNNQTGVTLQIATDGDLEDASTNTIDAVADGTVTAGDEEYGIAVTGSSLTIDPTYNSGDNAIVQSADDIASSAGSVSNATMDITYKASIAGTTVAGSYSQVVTVTVASNS
jgi:hypothetical protein